MSSTLQFAIMSTDRAAADRFIERLSTFAVDDWSSVAAAVARDADHHTSTTGAIESLIVRYQLGFDAWCIADDVDAAVHYSVGSPCVRLSRRETASLCVARPAAKSAALGMFLRPLLTPIQFESLYRPFASVIPLAAEASPPRPLERRAGPRRPRLGTHRAHR